MTNTPQPVRFDGKIAEPDPTYTEPDRWAKAHQRSPTFRKVRRWRWVILPTAWVTLFYGVVTLAVGVNRVLYLRQDAGLLLASLGMWMTSIVLAGQMEQLRLLTETVGVRHQHESR